jgi:hypothetical protein
VHYSDFVHLYATPSFTVGSSRPAPFTFLVIFVRDGAAVPLDFCACHRLNLLTLLVCVCVCVTGSPPRLVCAARPNTFSTPFAISGPLYNHLQEQQQLVETASCHTVFRTPSQLHLSTTPRREHQQHTSALHRLLTSTEELPA